MHEKVNIVKLLYLYEQFNWKPYEAEATNRIQSLGRLDQVNEVNQKGIKVASI